MDTATSTNAAASGSKVKAFERHEQTDDALLHEVLAVQCGHAGVATCDALDQRQEVFEYVLPGGAIAALRRTHAEPLAPSFEFCGHRPCVDSSDTAIHKNRSRFKRTVPLGADPYPHLPSSKRPATPFAVALSPDHFFPQPS
jgi:hypothetical protein